MCSKPANKTILVTMNTNRGDMNGQTVYGTDVATPGQPTGSQIDALSKEITELKNKLAQVQAAQAVIYSGANSEITTNSMFSNVPDSDTQSRCPAGYYVDALTLHWNKACGGQCTKEAALYAVTLSCRKLVVYP